MNQLGNGSAIKTGYPVRYFDQHQVSPSVPVVDQSSFNNFVSYPPASAYMHNNQTMVTSPPFDNSYNQILNDNATNQYFNQPYLHSKPSNKSQSSPKRNNRKKAPYSKPSNTNLFYCELCKISCAGEQPYKLHCEGQKHRKKELISKNASSNSGSNSIGNGSAQKSNYFCEVCSVPCSGIDSFNAHLNGKSHIKVCNLQVKMGKEVSADLVAPIMKQSNTVTNTKTVNPFSSVLAASARPPSSSGGSNFKNENCNVKVIGTPVINFIKGGSLKTMTSDSDAVIEEVKEENVNDSNNLLVQQTENSQNEMNDQTVLESDRLNDTSGKEITSLINNSTTSEIPLLTEILENTISKTNDPMSGQPIGQEFITEYTIPNSKAIYYSCSLCNCKFSEIVAKEQHLRGKRHHKNYKSQDKSKVNQSPIVRANTSSITNKSSPVNSPFLNRPQPSLLPNPQFSPQFVGQRGRPPSFSQLFPSSTSKNRSSSMNNRSLDLSLSNQSISLNTSIDSANEMIDETNGFQTNMDLSWLDCVESKFKSMDNRYLFKKHSEIVPKEDDLKLFYKHISNVEKSLKQVSDDFLNDSSALKDIVPDLSLKIDARILQGEIRAGLFGKKLLLRDENQIDLILFCSIKPTITLLVKLMEILSTKLKNYEDEEYQVIENIEEAAIDVKASGSTTIRVTLTSLIIRDVNLPKNALTHEYKDPEQMLDRQKCLDALKALRRFKWYQAKLAPFNPCPMIVRILRDLTKRVDAWKVLTSWSLELICERVMSTCLNRPTPADAFRLILQTLASGVLIRDHVDDILIADPCEIEPTDALGFLTDKQRQDITESAQTMVQFITFNKIYKILDTDVIKTEQGEDKIDKTSVEKKSDDLQDNLTIDSSEMSNQPSD